MQFRFHMLSFLYSEHGIRLICFPTSSLNASCNDLFRWFHPFFFSFMFALDNFGNTPLLEAIKNGHDHVASLLVKAGGLLTIDDAGDFLCKIVSRKDVDLLKRLLACGINPNVRNYDHRTPLHIAASEGSYSVARLFLESGASVLCRDRFNGSIYFNLRGRKEREREQGEGESVFL